MNLTQITVYPVKGLRGVDLPEARALPQGLERDRRWMLVDAQGQFLSQRTLPQMATLEVQLAAEGTVVTDPSGSVLVPLYPPPDAELLPVQVWRDTVPGALAGPEFDLFFTRALGLPCRLVGLTAHTRRPVNPRYGRPGDEVSFADGFPFLLIGEPSLAQLNDRLDEPVPMNRFRPNLVFSGGEPGAEDQWTRVLVGEVPFDVAKPSFRCIVTTTDQFTGERRGPEPLRELAQFRSVEGQVMFGQNLIARGTGTLRLGDALVPEDR